MFIHGFHVSVIFSVKVFNFSVNVFGGGVNVGYCYIRCGRRGMRENNNCFNEGYWDGACVCGGRNFVEYILVGLVG